MSKCFSCEFFTGLICLSPNINKCMYDDDKSDFFIDEYEPEQELDMSIFD